MYTIGIDSGTQSIKAIVIDATGKIIRQGARRYDAFEFFASGHDIELVSKIACHLEVAVAPFAKCAEYAKLIKRLKRTINRLLSGWNGKTGNDVLNIRGGVRHFLQQLQGMFCPPATISTFETSISNESVGNLRFA